MKKTSSESYFLQYYCISTVLSVNIWQELELELEPEPESEPEPKLWTKVELEPESEPKQNNFGFATLMGDFCFTQDRISEGKKLEERCRQILPQKIQTSTVLNCSPAGVGGRVAEISNSTLKNILCKLCQIIVHLHEIKGTKTWFICWWQPQKKVRVGNHPILR